MAKLVGDPRDERRLGPDDDEVDAERPRQLEDGLGVLGPDGVAGAKGCDARVSGRGVELLERMLTARGFAPDDPVAAEGDEPEVLANFRAAREITRLAESGADLSPGDIAPAIENYREVYRILTEQRAAP